MKQFLRHDETKDTGAKSGSSDKEFDEYEFLCVFNVLGLPYSLLGDLPVFACSKIMKLYGELKHGKSGAEEFTPEERKQMYSITKKDEERIRKYLEAKEGV